METAKKVLLTGITGFVGMHTAIQLLEKGYQVTGTLRDAKKVPAIKKVIAEYTSNIENLHFAEANLNDEKIWEELMIGVDYVQHIASPFPKTIPKNEDDLIVPARKGTLSILSAAAKNNVKRVVITGSSASVTYGQPKSERKKTFNEKDWTNLNQKDDLTPYFKSKTIAERAAWDFIKNDPSGLELAVVCPALILGPLLVNDFNASSNVIIKVLDGSMPAIPKIGWEMVDVRSIASLLILAMEKEEAANQRYIGSSGFVGYSQMTQMLKKTYPQQKVPTRQLPNFMVHLFSYIDPAVKQVLLDLGTERKLNNSKAKNQLGWKPIEPEKTILASAKSIFDLGIVKRK